MNAKLYNRNAQHHFALLDNHVARPSHPKLHRYSTERDVNVPYDTMPIRDWAQRLETIRHPTDTVPNATLPAPHETALYPTYTRSHDIELNSAYTRLNLTQGRITYTSLHHDITRPNKTIPYRYSTKLNSTPRCIHGIGPYTTLHNRD